MEYNLGGDQGAEEQQFRAGLAIIQRNTNGGCFNTGWVIAGEPAEVSCFPFRRTAVLFQLTANPTYAVDNHIDMYNIQHRNHSTGVWDGNGLAWLGLGIGLA